MFKNKLGEDSPILKFIHLKIRRRDGVESLMTLEEGEIKVPIDGCIRSDTEPLQNVEFILNEFFTQWNRLWISEILTGKE